MYTFHPMIEAGVGIDGAENGLLLLGADEFRGVAHLALAAGFDLYDVDSVSVEGNDVQLCVAVAPVAGDDAEAESLEVVAGDILAPAALIFFPFGIAFCPLVRLCWLGPAQQS